MSLGATPRQGSGEVTQKETKEIGLNRSLHDSPQEHPPDKKTKELVMTDLLHVLHSNPT